MALEKKDIQELIKALREAAGKEKADEKSTADLTPEEKEESINLWRSRISALNLPKF